MPGSRHLCLFWNTADLCFFRSSLNGSWKPLLWNLLKTDILVYWSHSEQWEWRWHLLIQVWWTWSNTAGVLRRTGTYYLAQTGSVILLMLQDHSTCLWNQIRIRFLAADLSDKTPGKVQRSGHGQHWFKYRLARAEWWHVSEGRQTALDIADEEEVLKYYTVDQEDKSAVSHSAAASLASHVEYIWGRVPQMSILLPLLTASAVSWILKSVAKIWCARPDWSQMRSYGICDLSSPWLHLQVWKAMSTSSLHLMRTELSARRIHWHKLNHKTSRLLLMGLRCIDFS
jgi:hypothetical protein